MRNLLCVLLVIGVLLSSFSVMAEVEPTPQEDLYANLAVSMGDVDQNKVVDAKDALQILQYSVKKRERFDNSFQGVYQQGIPFEADLNGDTLLDAKDALLALKTSVKKWEPNYTNLQRQDYQTKTYGLNRSTPAAFAPVLLKTLEQVQSLALPTNVKNALSQHNFETSALVVFAEPANVQLVPTVCQVAVNENHLLIRYRYTDYEKIDKRLIAVSLPQSAVKNINKISVSQVEWANALQPAMYCLEYNMPQANAFETQMVVLRNEGDVHQLLSYMEVLDIKNEEITDFLQYRANSGYFETHDMVVSMEKFTHYEAPLYYGVKNILLEKDVIIDGIETEGITAKVQLLGKTAQSQERLTVMVKVVDLNKEQLAGCEQIVFEKAPLTEFSLRTVCYDQYNGSDATAQFLQSKFEWMKVKNGLQTDISTLDSYSASDTIVKEVLSGTASADVFEVSLYTCRNLARKKFLPISMIPKL